MDPPRNSFLSRRKNKKRPNNKPVRSKAINMEKITHNYTHSNCQLCIGTQSVQIKRTTLTRTNFISFTDNKTHVGGVIKIINNSKLLEQNNLFKPWRAELFDIMGQTLQQLVSSQPSSDHHHGMTNTNLKGDITSLIYWWYVPRKMQKKYEYPASLAIKLRIQTERCRKKQG